MKLIEKSRFIAAEVEILIYVVSHKVKKPDQKCKNSKKLCISRDLAKTQKIYRINGKNERISQYMFKIINLHQEGIDACETLKQALREGFTTGIDSAETQLCL